MASLGGPMTERDARPFADLQFIASPSSLQRTAGVRGRALRSSCSSTCSCSSRCRRCDLERGPATGRAAAWSCAVVVALVHAPGSSTHQSRATELVAPWPSGHGDASLGGSRSPQPVPASTMLAIVGPASVLYLGFPHGRRDGFIGGRSGGSSWPGCRARRAGRRRRRAGAAWDGGPRWPCAGPSAVVRARWS